MRSPASWDKRVTDGTPNRRYAAGLIGAALGLALLSSCSDSVPWHAMSVSGGSPPLQFTMTRASDGKVVTAADYRRHVVMLYFGYTLCPDVCPTTLANIAGILSKLGSAAADVRVLFVTVDPNRDKLQLLARYVKQFAPQVDGLWGTPDQLERLARRYRIAYSVIPATKDHPYEVTHSSAVYIFDGSGTARLIVSSLASRTPDIVGTAADIRRLLPKPGSQIIAGRSHSAA
jgi:protein SCO1